MKSKHEELSDTLTTLQHEFEQYMAQQVSPRTARNHSHVIGLFIEYVCFGRGVQTIQEITRGMANSAFRAWYMSNVGAVTEGQVKTAIKKFSVLHKNTSIFHFRPQDSSSLCALTTRFFVSICIGTRENQLNIPGS